MTEEWLLMTTGNCFDRTDFSDVNTVQILLVLTETLESTDDDGDGDGDDDSGVTMSPLI
jgi:hypothetical protein